MKELPIGIFDSGVGGLTVAKEIIKQIPNEKFVYFEKTGTSNPKFKFRQVNFKNYLLYNGVITDKISIDSDEVIVVSIRDERNFYKEFIVLDKNKIATIHNKKYYIFEKISDNVDENLIGMRTLKTQKIHHF